MWKGSAEVDEPEPSSSWWDSFDTEHKRDCRYQIRFRDETTLRCGQGIHLPQHLQQNPSGEGLAKQPRLKNMEGIALPQWTLLLHYINEALCTWFSCILINTSRWWKSDSLFWCWSSSIATWPRSLLTADAPNCFSSLGLSSRMNL